MQRVCRTLQLFLLLGCPLALLAHDQPTHARLPDFDRRAELAVPAAADPAVQPRAGAVQRLRQLMPGVRVDVDPRRGTVRAVGSPRRLLTAPQEPGGAGGGGRERHEVVRGFLDQHAEVFGHDAGLLDEATLVQDRQEAGLRTVVWEQRYEELPVFESALVAHLTDKQELINVSSLLVPDLAAAALAGNPNWQAVMANPPVAAEGAVRRAARSLEQEIDEVRDLGGGKYQAGTLPGEARTRLVWLPLPGRAMRLCWEVHLYRRTGSELYRLLIDARTGDVLIRHRRTFYLSEASYRIFAQGSPAPMRPGLGEPSTNQASIVERELVTLTALNPAASPIGWIADGINETRGNNVEAHLDADGNDEPDLPRPQGNPFRVFDSPLDLSGPPSAYGQASVVNLFYWCNWMHDRLYELGFTETAGNFQKDNFGRGGIGGDPLLAEAQDGSGVNNANYTPQPDGISPRIQMFVFDGPEPDRDGDLDAEIILHEYTHGLTDRMVGGGFGIYELQTFGLGEGWSDFYALALLSTAEEDVDGAYPLAGYTTHQLLGLKQNYYFGIRRYPYSTDLSVNPLTYKDIDPAQAVPHEGVPINPLRPFDPLAAEEVHRQGEIWCVALWEVRANLIRKHGFERGNDLCLRLVTEGLRLTPPNPNFLQARDAILQADLARSGGANHSEIWAGFAKRGMGVSATAVPSWTTAGLREAFDLPDELTVLPVGPALFTGIVGGPVLPVCRIFVLTNATAKAVDWQAGGVPPWIDLTPPAGTVPPGGAVAVAACVNASVEALPAGTTGGSLLFTNLSAGTVVSRPLQLRLSGVAGVPFVETFETPALSPAWLLSGNGAHEAGLSSSHEPHSGEGHLLLAGRSPGVAARAEATLMLDLEGYTNVVLRFWVKRLGGIADPPPVESFVDSALFDGVAISTDGVRWHPVRAFTDTFDFYTALEVHLDPVVTANGLAYGGDFRIRFNFFGYGPAPQEGFLLDDISITGFAPYRFRLEAPAIVREGDGQLPGVGKLTLPSPLSSNLVVQLESSDTRELIVPVALFMPAGSREAAFTLRVADDALLDGATSVELTARAPGYVTGRTVVQVADNESARLTVLLPVAVREGDGVVTNRARVECDRPPSREIAVALSSSHPNEMRVPSRVVIPPGQTNAFIPLTVINDARLDGPVMVTVTGSVAGWGQGSDAVLVLDNEVASLALSVPAVAAENAGRLPEAGLVQLSAILATNLVVELSSGDPARLSVPAVLLFPAGTTQARIDLSLVDNGAVESNPTVPIVASAPGFASAIASVRIVDDETPPMPFRPFPPDQSTGNPSQVQLAWWLGVPELIVNGDFESGGLSGWQRQNLGEGDIIVTDGGFDPPGPVGSIPPLAGNYSALCWQASPGRHVLYQDVTVPLYVRTAVLTWKAAIFNNGQDYAADHGFRVEIRSVSDQLLTTAYQTHPGDPAGISGAPGFFDLSIYRGQRIRVAFVEEDSQGFLNVLLDDIRIMLGFDGATSSEVYFGTAPVLGEADLVAVTTNSIWAPPALADEQVYYWQVVSRRDGQRVPGPVWRFDTRGGGQVDHFAWAPMGGPMAYGTPFAVRLQAQDRLGRLATNFAGRLELSAQRALFSRPARVLTFLGYADPQLRKYRNTLGSVRLHNTNWVERSTIETDPVALQEELAGTDVFLVVEQQRASEETIAALGESWSVVLSNFVSNGGVVIVCSYSLQEHQLLVQAGLLALDKQSTIRSATLNSSHAEDPLLNGVPLPLTGVSVATYASSDDVLLQTAAEHAAVVVARHQGAGRIVLVGSDFAEPRSGLERVIANAIAATSSPVVEPVMLDRTHTGYLESGVWQGAVAVFDVAPDVVLVARDESGRLGRSAPVAVGGVQDLAVSTSVSPEQPTAGSVVEFALAVTNNGPATQVQLVNQFPPGLRGVSAQNDHGGCIISPDGTSVSCALSLGPGGGGLVRVSAEVLSAGLLTNIVDVSGLAGEVHLANNRSATVLEAALPSLFISDSSVAEGNAGLTPMFFTVRLAPSSSLPVAVEFVTESLSATAGEDYVARAGRIEFPPGQTTNLMFVPIIGDTRHEAIETLRVRLVRPEGAKILGGIGGGAILNDDGSPQLAVQDAQVAEGDAGQFTPAVFAVTLSFPSEAPVRVRYQTIDGTAEGGADYDATAGELLFPAGVTTQHVEVLVVGDDLSEADELFFLRLSSPVGATLGRAQALGAVFDDDAGRIERFLWDPVSTQYLHEPFPVRVTALDGFGGVVADFNQPIRLTGLSAPRDTELPSGSSSAWEYPLATFYDDARLQSIYLKEELGGAGRITALWLNVLSVPGQLLHNFTIRMAHTPLRFFTKAAWHEAQWTTVYAGDSRVQQPGWVRLALDVPYLYDGSQSLLIDFHFDNADHTSDGFCAAVTTPLGRSLFFRTDSAFGSPEGWNGTGPPQPLLSRRVPVLRLSMETPLPVTAEGSWSDGVWSGRVTPLGVGTDVQLRMDDFAGHEGVSDPFVLEVNNDLAVLIASDLPEVSLGGTALYTVLATNTGPALSTHVRLDARLLGPGVFLQAVPDQGSCQVSAAEVVCQLGELSSKSSIRVRCMVQALTPGLVTNLVSISRLEAEPYPDNNQASATVTVVPPTVNVGSVTVMEEDGPVLWITVPVALSHPTSQAASVQVFTMDGTATNLMDYVPIATTLNFPPGVTNIDLVVGIVGDVNDETDEDFSLELGQASQLVPGAPGKITILDNDPPPVVTVEDLRVVEGNDGFNLVELQARVFPPTEKLGWISFTLSGGTSTPGEDYLPINDLLYVLPGFDYSVVYVYVIGDTAVEEDETLIVEFSDPFEAVIGRESATLTILNDDGLENVLHHFEWSLEAQEVHAGQPLPVTLTATDAAGRPISSFAGAVGLAGRVGVEDQQVGQGSSRWEFPMGTGYEDARTTTLYLASELGGARSITGLALDVAVPPAQLLHNWTIRLKHTSNAFLGGGWDPDGWTTVHRGTVSITNTGWVTFPFTIPFAYNGQQHLLVDFVIDSDYYTFNGLCRYTPTLQPRTSTYQTDSEFGDPRQWRGFSPFSVARFGQLHMRFISGAHVQLRPPAAINFVQGVWRGNVTVDQAMTNLVLVADDGQGHRGTSPPLAVLWSLDADEDGLPDDWEREFFGSTTAADAWDDPDGDGLSNLAEFVAGTSPIDAGSVLRVVDARPVGGIVRVRFQSVPGRRYQLVWSEDLTPGSWRAAGEVVQASGALTEIADPEGVVQRGRFYRVELRP